MQIFWLLKLLQRRKGSPAANDLQIGPQMTPTNRKWFPMRTACHLLGLLMRAKLWRVQNSHGYRDDGGHRRCLDAINPTSSPRFRSHQETKMAARRTQRSISTMSRKYKGFRTVQLNRVQFSRLHVRSYPRFQILSRAVSGFGWSHEIKIKKKSLLPRVFLLSILKVKSKSF